MVKKEEKDHCNKNFELGGTLMVSETLAVHPLGLVSFMYQMYPNLKSWSKPWALSGFLSHFWYLWYLGTLSFLPIHNRSHKTAILLIHFESGTFVDCHTPHFLAMCAVYIYIWHEANKKFYQEEVSTNVGFSELLKKNKKPLFIQGRFSERQLSFSGTSISHLEAVQYNHSLICWLLRAIMG